MNKIYGYARCSTDETKQDIDRQKDELTKRGVPDDEKHLFYEYISSTKDHRIKLEELLSIVEEGDTIISTELTRITRSVKELIEIMELAREKKIKLILGNFEIDFAKDIDPMTIGMVQMMGVFGELEREITRQRVKSGLENARRKGKILGRRKVEYKNIPLQVRKMYDLYLRKEITKTNYAKACEITRPTLDKYIKIIEEYRKNE